MPSSTTNTKRELSYLSGYVVTDDQRQVNGVTDTFSTAIEVAEGRATELAREIDSQVANITVLVEGCDETDLDAGFYAKWAEYEESKGEATLEVFRVRVKPDGYIFAGSKKLKSLGEVFVRPVTMEFFNGFYVSYDAGLNDDDEYTHEGYDDDCTYNDEEK